MILPHSKLYLSSKFMSTLMFTLIYSYILSIGIYSENKFVIDGSLSLCWSCATSSFLPNLVSNLSLRFYWFSFTWCMEFIALGLWWMRHFFLRCCCFFHPTAENYNVQHTSNMHVGYVIILPQIRCETISMMYVYYPFFWQPIAIHNSLMGSLWYHSDFLLTMCWKTWSHQMNEKTTKLASATTSCHRIHRKWAELKRYEKKKNWFVFTPFLLSSWIGRHNCTPK